MESLTNPALNYVTQCHIYVGMVTQPQALLLSVVWPGIAVWRGVCILLVERNLKNINVVLLF